MTLRRRTWFVVHGWLALPIWALLFFVCATGTITVVRHEIAWLVDPRVRAPNPEGVDPVGFDAMAAAVKRAFPDAAILYIHDGEPYLATEFIVGLPDAPEATVYVNRYTGQVQGVIKGHTFAGFMRELHGWLLLPWTSGTSVGYYVVGLLALPLLCLLVTGLVVYKHFWRAYLTRPRLTLRRGARVFWGELHRLIGVWSVWFIALIGLTGLWFLLQGIFWDTQVVFESVPPVIAREEVPTAAPGSAVPRLGLDDAVAAARSTLPDLDVKWIIPPDNAFSNVGVYGKDWFPLVGDFATAVHVNPYTGAVAGSQRVEDLTALDLVNHAADPLHYGNFGGLWSKLVWFVFGLGLSMMALSGVLIWTKRTAKATARLRLEPNVPPVFRQLPTKKTAPAEAVVEE